MSEEVNRKLKDLECGAGIEIEGWVYFNANAEDAVPIPILVHADGSTCRHKGSLMKKKGTK